FTATLARTATWLETKDKHFAGTGATLRGAAIALLPANFMAVALLAGDPQARRRPRDDPAVPPLVRARSRPLGASRAPASRLPRPHPPHPRRPRPPGAAHARAPARPARAAARAPARGLLR